MDVLLVEDEPAIADAVIYALESEGITCAWVSTGAKALERVGQEPVELVLLDIGLPDANGFDVFRELRKRCAAKIVFLTSRSSEVDQVLGFELGADDYITKPFSPRILSARVRARLRPGSGGTDASASPTGGYIDDPESKRITFQGTLLELTRYEYGVLSTLMRHPGRIYSRSELMDLVWVESDDSFDRTVDTHIKVLRQKLKLCDPNAAPIKTHRGQGYSFSPHGQ